MLDNDLSPEIATALRLFNFDIVHFKEIPGFTNRKTAVDDPEIIYWCKDNNRVWITHDYESRRKHEEAMKLARINVVWIRGKVEPAIIGESASWRFFKLIVRSLDRLNQSLCSARGAIHFKLSQKIGTRPEIYWVESSFDRSRVIGN